MKSKWIAAAVQMRCEPGEPKRNLEAAAEWLKKAKAGGAEFAVFPEAFDQGYDSDFSRTKEAAAMGALGGKNAEFLAARARENKIALLAGLVETEGGKIYNRAVYCSAEGKIHRYSKIHLFCSKPIHEDKVFAPGKERVILDTPFAKLGTLICYDLRFPELTLKMALEGAEVFGVPSAWPLARGNTLRILSQARALENQVYVISANQVGKLANGMSFAGSSMIIAPDGKLLAQANETDEALLLGEISAEDRNELRDFMPVFQHRREELYR